jgi:hypothetical protein
VAAPGELLAITYGLSMAGLLAEALALAGPPANEIVVETSCTFTGPMPDRELTAVDFHVRARVPGLDGTAFDELVTATRRRSLRAAGAREDVPGRLEAELAPSH